MAARRVVVVGNGPLPRDLSAEVDSADEVVRFNEPKAAKGMSGTRCDRLFINNSGKPMQRRIADPAYAASPFVQAAREVIFAYHPKVIRDYLVQPNVLSRLRGRRSDWTRQAIEMLGRAGKEIRIMPPAFYEQGCDDLGIPADRRRTMFPSTGFLGLRYVVQHYSQPEWSIEICGFSHEGWKRHAWQDERGWVETKLASGALSLMVD
jgi:hypothetical protein